jgi:DNA-binding transcriptional ArsR family regulator
MIESLVSSKTKIKLLLKFFLNPEMTGYLRGLASEFDESTNAVRVELNKLEKAKVIHSEKQGRNKVFRANKLHPLFKDIRNIILKSSGIQSVIDNILNKLGDLEKAFVTGDYAQGIDSGIIDLVLIGNNLNQKELDRVVLKTEGLIERKIRILKLSSTEFFSLEEKLKKDGMFLLWEEK